ncbi:MAG: hypothetical protein JNJ93_03785 [Acinetobacter sp.]|nr:hypothetical protein [Acinetobacter sp.]
MSQWKETALCGGFFMAKIQPADYPKNSKKPYSARMPSRLLDALFTEKPYII